jgi:uncharacterized membrane protein YphA (DoxX/SURF4 family)
MLAQLGGGILLIFGALTPLAAIAGTMLTATIFLINRGEPFINPGPQLGKFRFLFGGQRRRSLVTGCVAVRPS